MSEVSPSFMCPVVAYGLQESAKEKFQESLVEKINIEKVHNELHISDTTVNISLLQGREFFKILLASHFTGYK